MRTSYHLEDQSPGTGSAGRDRGGGRKGEEAQGTSQKIYRRDVENVEDLGGRGKKRKHESVGSVGANPGYLENCKERMSPLSRLIRGFRNTYH